MSWKKHKARWYPKADPNQIGWCMLCHCFAKLNHKHTMLYSDN